MSLRQRRQILEWEKRWDIRTGLVTFAAVVILIVSAIVIAGVNGSGEADLLRSAYENKGSVTLSSILEAIGFVLLLAPLYFLFRATAARNDRVRTQLVGVIIAAPLFFGISGVLNGVATNEGAETFHKGEAKPSISHEKATEECKSELQDKGAKEFGEEYDGKGTPSGQCVDEELEDDAAQNALSEATFRGVSTGFGLAGRIGLAFALVYTCLFAMRSGLLSRFWGSLGMALGVAALLLLVQFCLIFFIYFGLLLVRKLPGGRPPAWAAGESIPWETPGQRVASQLEGEGPRGDDDAIDTGAEDVPVQAPEPEEAGDGSNGDGGGDGGGGPPKRKRKRRN